MTFPNEHKVSQRAEMELMVKSAFSDPGSFFGLMSMCAAHRAILAGRHSDLIGSLERSHRVLHDPDYYIMKVKCIREMNTKVRDPGRALSDEAFDTIINLLTSALIVGLFDEARIHLTGLKQMVELRGGITEDSIRGSSMLAAIITTDIKSASGLMAKPVFPLTWDSQPVPADIQKRVKPPESSPLNGLGAALFANNLLSFPLLRILHVLRDIVFFNQTYKQNPNGLYPEDHDFFRVINCEIEHQLLSYIYPESGNEAPSFPGTTLDPHPIEAATRTASICYLNHFLIVSPPSSGLGRALTGHLKKAVSNCTLSLLSQLPKENYDLLAWVFFIGAQGSIGQTEHPWFVERLARVAMICGWRSWKQVSDKMTGYTYVPNINGSVWKSIWNEAMAGLVPDVM
ncbi:hypothetical protein MW887_007872 [Aspergillus wentii]|nr:hypothetical protein MW887_007872 [Aspergillus wentii]